MVSRRTFLELLGSSSIVGSVEELTYEETTADADSERLIGAHYYTWYGPNNHWSNGYTGTPTLGEYDSQDSAVIKKHVEWAENNGIGWFNATWWGPDSYSARTLEDHVAPVLAGTDVKFSVLYEPKGRFEYNESTVNFDEQENRERLAGDFEHITSEMVDNPNYLHIDGKPVLYVYIARSFTGDVTGAFENAQTRVGTDFYLIGDYGRTSQLPHPVFDAVSPYNMYRPIKNTNSGFTDYVTHAYEGWHLLSQEANFEFIPLVLPGFNNTEANWAPDGQPVLNRSPEQYRNLCSIARRYMNDEREMALITSFNEWHEYTSIEPGEQFKTTYLDITNEHLSSGKSLAPTRELVPLTFHWQNYILESSVNSDVPEGSGRRLTIALDDLQLLNSTGGVVETYDIGGADEPVLTHGISNVGSHNGRTWRWCTANRLMTSTLHVPVEVASKAERIAFRCRALEDGFSFDISLAESKSPTSVSVPRGWNNVSTELRGQSTSTETETRSLTRTETHSPSSTDTDTTSSPLPSQSSTSPVETQVTSEEETSASTPGFGIGTGLLGAGVGTCYAAYRRFASNTDDEAQ